MIITTLNEAWDLYMAMDDNYNKENLVEAIVRDACFAAFGSHYGVDISKNIDELYDEVYDKLWWDYDSLDYNGLGSCDYDIYKTITDKLFREMVEAKYTNVPKAKERMVKTAYDLLMMYFATPYRGERHCEAMGVLYEILAPVYNRTVEEFKELCNTYFFENEELMSYFDYNDKAEGYTEYFLQAAKVLEKFNTILPAPKKI